MLRVHLDTDIGGDTDDLCALAMLLGSPEVDLVGVTTVTDTEGQRLGFVRHALDLAGRSNVPTASGAFGFLSEPQRAEPQVFQIVEVQPWSRIPERQLALVAYGG